jgi:CHAD domain-containing protein
VSRRPPDGTRCLGRVAIAERVGIDNGPPVARYLIARYNVSIMDAGYRLLAAKYIRRQAKQLAEQLEGVRAAEDIEFVHRARVATRRLRTALRMFDGCFTSRQVRRWQQAIRRTTARLGDARDRDVQIEYLCGTLSTLNAKECFPGIARVLVQVERNRERLQRKVVKAVDRLEAKGVLRKMRRVSKGILRDAALAEPPALSPAAYIKTEQHVRRQLDELLRQQDSLADPQCRERHHAMRIAAKRLRYALEIARSVYPGELEQAVEAIKRVQTLLGDVHDCDVWTEHLDAFEAAERVRITALFGHAGRLVRLRAGIEHLREDRRRHREEVFRQLVEYWDDLGRQHFWEGLRDLVRPRGETCVPSTSPLVGGGSATATPTSEAVATPTGALPEPPIAETAATPVFGPTTALSALQPELAAPESRPHGNGGGRARPAAPKPLLTAGS